MVGCVNEADPDAILAGLDAEQRAVATAPPGPVVVIAGAGTGKTRAITHRIAYAVATGRVNPRSVLAVTFTTRAAGELRARLRTLGVGGVQARTFHSAALSQVRYFWPAVMGSQPPQVLGSPLSLIAEACHRARLPVDTALLRDLAGEISWAKTTNVTVADYPEIAAQQGRRAGALEPAQVARLMTEYERIKGDRGFMDFDDILLADAALVSRYPQVAAQVRGQYKHFVVDEYQDVSPIQHAVLRQWLGASNDVCVVGDPAQSIHAFAGAQRRYLLDFAHEFPGATRISLVRNYRSTRTICTLANRMASTAGKTLGTVQLVPSRPDGVAVQVAPHVDEADEASGVAAWLSACHEGGLAWPDLGVLFRVNAQSPALESALTQAGIPYVVRGSERFYDRPEIRRALHALQGAARTDPDQPGLAGVEAVLTGLGWSAKAPEGTGRVREQWESWQALLGLAAELADGRADASLGELVAGFADREQLQQVPSETGVTLSTMHSSKGLEWRGVALVGLHEGMMPIAQAKSPEQVDEEHRLLYVGITRARDVLRLSWSKGARGGRHPSRFLDGLGLDEVEAAASGRGLGKAERKKERRVVLCRVCGKVLQTGGEVKLGRHLGCPATYDEALLDRLKAWRLQTARAANVPAYVVFTDATLTAIAEALPDGPEQLARVPGVGPVKLERYADDVLELVAGVDGNA